jgi:phosphoribosylformylglycinamidine cyclo-ligase
MKFLADVAGVPREDMERTWNCGIGMCAIVAPAAADLIVRSLAARGMKAWIAGTVEKSDSAASPRSLLTSDYQ